MRRTFAGAAAVLALALTGCGAPTTHIRANAAGTSSGTSSTRTYVALGDSYTSGPEIGGAAAVSGRTVCGQSDRNYPHLVAARLRLRLRDVSCGGAQTVNMTQPQDRGGVSVPPQLGALRRGTDAVSIGIGGNDFSVFIRIVGGCVQLAQQDPTGSPCTDQLATSSDWLATYTDALRGRVVKVLRAVQRRSPHARVVVVGYPQIVPASGHCSALPLAAGDYAFARQVNRAFDVALRGAARRVRATYADTWAASVGHDICAANPWIAGAVPAGQAAPYHPYAVEQRAVARLVVKALAGLHG